MFLKIKPFMKDIRTWYLKLNGSSGFKVECIFVLVSKVGCQNISLRFFYQTKHNLFIQN